MAAGGVIADIALTKKPLPSGVRRTSQTGKIAPILLLGRRPTSGTLDSDFPHDAMQPPAPGGRSS